VAGLSALENSSKESATSAAQTQQAIADIDQQIASLNETMEKL
jgi:hypothetical protein